MNLDVNNCWLPKLYLKEDIQDTHRLFPFGISTKQVEFDLSSHSGIPFALW